MLGRLQLNKFTENLTLFGQGSLRKSPANRKGLMPPVQALQPSVWRLKLSVSRPTQLQPQLVPRPLVPQPVPQLVSQPVVPRPLASQPVVPRPLVPQPLVLQLVPQPLVLLLVLLLDC